MDIPELLQAFVEEKKRIDAVMAADLQDCGDSHLYELLSHSLFNGGKRIRPLLTILAAKLAGENVLSKISEDKLYRMATTFEYLHAASLLHDDVIDNANQRRGKPAANAVWGINRAILAGDWLHARAMTIAGTLGGPQPITVIGRATEAMIAAEFLQRSASITGDYSEHTYFSVLMGKTASLIAAACETGLLLADGTGEDLAAIRLYGGNIGIAFQIVDDLLDYLGDPVKTGKNVGNDFLEGKMTLPLIHALTCKYIDTEDLLQLLRKPREMRKKYFSPAKELIEKAGGFLHARKIAASYIADATTALERFSDSTAKKILTALADFVLIRDK